MRVSTRVEASRAFMKRLHRRPPPWLAAAFERAVDSISADPFAMRPDKPAVWRRVHPDMANHRHLDLPHGRRLCYTVAGGAGRPPHVRLLFLGTHKEYERLYGFSVS